MSNKNANIGARLDRLPNSGWHIKMWLVSAFALLVCWSNGIGGAVQNVLLNELHWLEPGSTLLAMWGTTYTAGQLFGALVGGPIGDKIGRKKSILLYEVIHIIAMIGGAAAPNVTVLYVFRLIQGFGLGALLVVLFAAFTEYVPGKNRGVWSSRNSFIGNFAHPICNGIALVIVSTGVSMNMNWRIQYIIPSVLSIIASIIIYNKYPESPRWLESQGRVEEADAIMTSIEKEIEASTGKPLPPVEAVEAKAVKNLPYSALFKGKLLKRTIPGTEYFVPIQKTMDVLNDLKAQGKIKAIGAANVDINHIQEYIKYGDLDIIQCKYSILDRGIEDEIIPCARENGITIQCYSPLEMGLLSGTFPRDYKPVGAQIPKKWFQPENMQNAMDMMESWKPLCEKYDCTIANLALGWILAQGDFLNLLSGSTTVDEIRENVKSAELELDPEDVAFMRESQKKSINKNQKEIPCERKIENVGKHGKKSLNSTISMIE